MQLIALIVHKIEKEQHQQSNLELRTSLIESSDLTIKFVTDLTSSYYKKSNPIQGRFHENSTVYR